MNDNATQAPEAQAPEAQASEALSQEAQRAHHISVTDVNQRVTIKIGGTLIAESTNVKLLAEGDLPKRYYIPRSDIRMDLLTATKTSSHCPFKGDAVYWSAQQDGAQQDSAHTDIAWSYPDPIPAVADIAGLVSFYNESVELGVEDLPSEDSGNREA